MGWYNDNWQYRVKITIQNSKVDVDVTDFPVYVNLANLPSGFHSHCNQTDARDIRVTRSDGTTECAREVVSYNAASDTGELWFKANTLLNSTDVDFYIYYGNSGASDYNVTDTYGRNNTWNNNFEGVWHLQEDPSGTSPQMIDSTVNGYNGTSQGTMLTEDSVNAVIGKGLELDGTNDYIQTTCPQTNYTYGTILLWFKCPDAPDNRAYDGVCGGGNKGIYWHHSAGSIYQGAAEVEIGGNWINPTFGTLSGNTNYHLGLVNYFGGHVQTFKNGQLVTDDDTYEGTDLDSNGTNFRIGAYGSNETCYGIIDEVWYMSDSMDVEWISTTYNNQSSPNTFYSVGAEEYGTSIKTINGLAKASIKTFNGLAITSVKTINGIT